MYALSDRFFIRVLTVFKGVSPSGKSNHWLKFKILQNQKRNLHPVGDVMRILPEPGKVMLPSTRVVEQS